MATELSSFAELKKAPVAGVSATPLGAGGTSKCFCFSSVSISAMP